MDIATRFQELERERKEKLQKMREDKEKEDTTHSFKPTISQKSAGLNRGDQVVLNKNWVSMLYYD
jgi:hypothetical protein